MLVKCPECANDVSDAAAACPKCGHPMQASAAAPSPTPTPQKVSHSSGWISLGAFLFASFTPAILAPIFVLAGLIFAGKELSGGGKKFGALVLCLSLLQGWFVLDHFGHVSANLGITTAKDADAQAVARYANVSLDVPGDWRSIAESKCREEWASDYRMQDYCVRQQSEAAQQLATGAPADIDADAFRVIRGKCSEEWPRDFKMRAYCERQQYEGFRSLNTSSTSDPVRNTCAQKWPNDFKMRKYCETRGG